MRIRSLLVTTASMLCLFACGGGNTRQPLAPSATGLSVVPNGAPAGPVTSSVQVSWACFTAMGAPGTFCPSGCGSPVTTARLLPSVTRAAVNAPNAPTNLTATVSGSIVTLNWAAPATGDAPTSYTILAGSGSGRSDIANFSTGTAATSLTVFNVPAGTYFVRIYAVNSGGSSILSNEVQLVVAGGASCASVGPPVGLSASVTGSTVALTWTAPTVGCAPTTYIVQAGSTSGLSNLANFSTGSTATTYTAAGVLPGTYYVRVLSGAPGVLSAASNEVVVTLPAAAPPTGIIAGFQFFDPGAQAGATTTCRIVSEFVQSPTLCQARSTSFTTGTNAIVQYDWKIEYFYATPRTVTQSGTSSTVSFGDTCGGPGSTDDGVAVPVQITLTVTDNLGSTATIQSGTGSQPPLFLRLFRC